MKIYEKYHCTIDMVVHKFKYHIWERGLEFDDLRQEGEVIYIKAIQKMGDIRVSNIGAYLWKVVYRRLKAYIGEKDYFLCQYVVAEEHEKSIFPSVASDIDKAKLAYLMQKTLSKLNYKKRFVVESLFGFNGKNVISQARIGRTLGMSYQGVGSKLCVIIGQLRKNKELMALLGEFKNGKR